MPGQDAKEALRIGLVRKVVPEHELMEFVIGYAKTGASSAPLTVTAIKHIINETMKPESARDLAACRAKVDAAFASEDYIEGRYALMEKRPPDFKGR